MTIFTHTHPFSPPSLPSTHPHTHTPTPQHTTTTPPPPDSRVTVSRSISRKLQWLPMPRRGGSDGSKHSRARGPFLSTVSAEVQGGAAARRRTGTEDGKNLGGHALHVEDWSARETQPASLAAAGAAGARTYSGTPWSSLPSSLPWCRFSTILCRRRWNSWLSRLSTSPRSLRTSSRSESCSMCRSWWIGWWTCQCWCRCRWHGSETLLATYLWHQVGMREGRGRSDKSARPPVLSPGGPGEAVPQNQRSHPGS